MNCSTPGFPVHHQLPELTQIHVHQVSDAIQPSHPLSSPSSPAFNLSQHQVFSSESVLCVRWPKYWSFSFSIIPSNEYSGLISLRRDWLDLLAVQGTLKSLLLHCIVDFEGSSSQRLNPCHNPKWRRMSLLYGVGILRLSKGKGLVQSHKTGRWLEFGSKSFWGGG